MRLAYHGATHIRSDMATDIKAASRAGFKGIEVWAGKIDDFLKKDSPGSLAELFTDHGVKPVSINSIEFIGFRGSEYPRVQDRCRELSEIAAKVGCPLIVVVPSPTPRGKGIELNYPWEEVVDEYVRVLTDMAGIARPHNVRLTFEFIGFGWSSVRTPAGAWEIVSKTNLPDVGMTFDSCHFYAGGGELQELSHLDPDRIYTFHINDMERVPKEAATDARRLLPGLGAIPLDDYCKALQEIGYDGLCSIEIFRTEYWQWDPFELAARARETALGILEKFFDVE